MEKGLDINVREALRLLGYGDAAPDPATADRLDEAIGTVRQTARPKFTYGFFDFEKTDLGIELEGTNLVFEGKDVAEHLSRSKRCAVMAATIGAEIERELRELSTMDAARHVMLDAAAGAAVETLCDNVQEEIAAEAAKTGLCPTTRFSPGYGDLPLELQPEIARALDMPRRIGVTVTPSCMLVPRKSVTAILGLQEEPFETTGPMCDRCRVRDHCHFRAKGLYCGK